MSSFIRKHLSERIQAARERDWVNDLDSMKSQEHTDVNRAAKIQWTGNYLSRAEENKKYGDSLKDQARLFTAKNSLNDP